MINTPSLLTELQRRNIALTVEANTLKVDAPKGTLTPELAQEIRAHKAELLHLLGSLNHTRQEPDERQTSPYGRAPLVCRKCLTTNPNDFKVNLLRSRWICCNCGEPSHRVFFSATLTPLPEPATPGAEVEQLRQEVTEMIQAGQAYHESTEQGTTPDPHTEHDTEPLPVVEQGKQKKATPLNTLHAILTDTSLVFCVLTEQGRKVQTLPVGTPEHLGNVCNLANEHSITHVWIMPGTELANKVTREFVTPDSDTWDTFSSYTGDETDELETRFPLFSRIWKKNTTGQYGRTVNVGYPWRGSWQWIADHPVTLLATIDYLEKVLGVPVEWSPGHMFTALVKLLNKKANRQKWVRDVTFDLKALPFNKSARDLVWKCVELLCTPGQELYLQEYDKNSAYLAACPGVMVGAGEPIHLTDCSNIDVTLPGIYRVTASPGASIFNGETLPLFINTEWVTSDVLSYALKLGYEVTIHECYQWEEKHRTLESTATHIWNARHSLDTDTVTYPHTQGRENAYNTMKQVALIGVGKFAYKKAAYLPRPDYWADVVGKARSTMAMKVYQLQQQGYTPVLIYADNMYFLTPDSNPVTAIPGLMERSDKLGGFKSKSTLLVTPEIIEAFKTLSPGKLKEKLNELAGSTEE